jgi:hypothetical protein
MVHLLQSRIDEAIVWLEKARSATPEKPYNHLHHAAAYALNGDFYRAALELAEARRLDAGTLYSSIADLTAFPGPWWGMPKIRALYEATYFAGLRKAGMPEERAQPLSLATFALHCQLSADGSARRVAIPLSDQSELEKPRAIQGRKSSPKPAARLNRVLTVY